LLLRDLRLIAPPTERSSRFIEDMLSRRWRGLRGWPAFTGIDDVGNENPAGHPRNGRHPRLNNMRDFDVAVPFLTARLF
jgi:hypothetical protein